MNNVIIKRMVENTKWSKIRSLEVATELLCKKVSNLEKIFENTCRGGILKYPWRIANYEGFCQIKLFVFFSFYKIWWATFCSTLYLLVDAFEQLFPEHLTN